MNAAEILRKAKELIADPTRWTKGEYARASRGFSCPAKSGAAQCFCALGAVIHVTGRTAYDLERDLTIVGPLYVAAGGDRRPFGAAAVTRVNDLGEHADVMQLFDKAIELAEADATKEQSK